MDALRNLEKPLKTLSNKRNLRLELLLELMLIMKSSSLSLSLKFTLNLGEKRQKKSTHLSRKEMKMKTPENQWFYLMRQKLFMNLLPTGSEETLQSAPAVCQTQKFWKKLLKTIPLPSMKTPLKIKIMMKTAPKIL